MRIHRAWQGVRMRTVQAGADPDAPTRAITLPASWDDAAAAALAALVPGSFPIDAADAAQGWIGRLDAEFAEPLHDLLLRRRATGAPGFWQGQGGGFILSLGAFLEPSRGFDIAGFAAAVTLAARVCRAAALQAPGCAPGCALALSGLDDLLAALGLPYDSPVARDTAAALAALARAEVEIVLGGDQQDWLAGPATWPPPPPSTAIRGLGRAAAHARAAVRVSPGPIPDPIAALVVQPPGPVEALLGVESGGIAPAFGFARDGRLTMAAENRLAAAGLSPAAALAAMLMGDQPLPLAGMGAHAAMHDAIAPYLHAMPPRPAAQPSLVPERQELPARRMGLTQKAAIGDHRLFLRTGEYEDGRVGEIAISLPRESAHFRALLECFSEAVSIGLQHGVPLTAFADAFAGETLAYTFRALASHYLGAAPPAPVLEPAAAGCAPLLPLELPRARGLRLVG